MADLFPPNPKQFQSTSPQHFRQCLKFNYAVKLAQAIDPTESTFYKIAFVKVNTRLPWL